jgi:hypothetical protein
LKTDSLNVQVDGRLLKIQHHSMEYWMLQLMFVFMGRFIAVNRIYGNQYQQTRSAIVAQQFEDAIANFPKYIMPDHRKKRPYLSSILSKNERSSSNAYNKKLFFRTQLGHYMINPELLIKVQGEWKKIYEWLPLDENIVFFEPDYVDSGEVIDRDLLKTAAWSPDFDRRWEVIQARYQQEQLDARRMFLREMMGQNTPIADDSSPIETPTCKNELDQGVWTDLKTGLMWMRCSMGQTWDGKHAQGEAKAYSWEKAQQAIDDMNKNGGFAGYIDWRLPDIEALKTIIPESKAVNTPQCILFKPSKKHGWGLYWSASPHAHGSNYAWDVDFYYGGSGSNCKSVNSYVRAVRAGQ